MRFNMNILIWQTRFPFDYITVIYSAEDTEITLAPNCEDFKARKPSETQRLTDLHYQSYQMLRACTSVHHQKKGKQGSTLHLNKTYSYRWPLSYLVKPSVITLTATVAQPTAQVLAENQFKAVWTPATRISPSDLKTFRHGKHKGSFSSWSTVC